MRGFAPLLRRIRKSPSEMRSNFRYAFLMNGTTSPAAGVEEHPDGAAAMPAI